MRVFTAITLFLASLCIADPIEAQNKGPRDSSINCAADPVSERQLGYGPSYSSDGTSWSSVWRDRRLKKPIKFEAFAAQNCSYYISFQRDARDTKWKLAYYAVFEATCADDERYITPTELEFRGPTKSDGRREYFAYFPNACSRFVPEGDIQRPDAFVMYFTVADRRTNGFVTPYFRAQF